MFENESISLLCQQEGALLWKEGLLQLFRYLEENRAVCLCALRSMGHDHIKRFFASDIYAIIHLTIEQLAEEIGVRNHLDSFVDVEMLTHFYVVALAGIMESWLLGEIDRTPEQLIQFADTMLNDQVRVSSARVQSRTQKVLAIFLFLENKNPIFVFITQRWENSIILLFLYYKKAQSLAKV